MNYITKIFRKDAIELNSPERHSLQQYVKLANKLGTRNILIHMPYSKDEMFNVGDGFKVIYDELLKKEMVVHLEITAWCKNLMDELKIHNSNPREYVSNYLTKIVNYMNIFPSGKFYVVFDTAHLFADGCEVDDMIFIMEKFRGMIKYIHLNGNINGKFTSDSHVPLFSSKNKIKNWEKLSKYCASLNVVCIAEITKMGTDWEKWEEFAGECGFKLVNFNKEYSF